MVLSTTKRTSSIASITRQYQGGGDMKAGIPRATNTATFQAYHERGLPQPMSFMMMPTTRTVRSNGGGIGWRFRER